MLVKDYEILTAKIVTMLETGTAPWQQPWKHNALGLPINATTGVAYRGINAVVLMAEAAARGGDPRFATFNQAKAAGWSIKKGAHGIRVVKYVTLQKKGKTPSTEGVEVSDSGTFVLPKIYYVFGAVDIDGIPERSETPAITPRFDTDDELRRIEQAAGVPLVFGGNRAAYNRGRDEILLPAREQFHSKESYLATLFHELGHATGHESRLNRTFGVFGDPNYAFEELVAELASLYVGAATGVMPDETHVAQHAAYVENWLEVLKKDPKALTQAASLAQKASDWLLEKITGGQRDPPVEE